MAAGTPTFAGINGPESIDNVVVLEALGPVEVNDSLRCLSVFSVRAAQRRRWHEGSK